jgi:hypothetical protein
LKNFVLGVGIKSGGLPIQETPSIKIEGEMGQGTHGFIKEKEMNFWLMGTHERTSKGDTLPLKTW